MFGAYIRAVLTIGVAVLAAAILETVGGFLLPHVGAQGGYLYKAFNGLIENALFIMLIGIAAALIARSVVESKSGVR